LCFIEKRKIRKGNSFKRKYRQIERVRETDRVSNTLPLLFGLLVLVFGRRAGAADDKKLRTVGLKK